LEFLGEKIELKGWKKYRAGLDVSAGTTGEHSIYTVFKGYEVMFHVSTLLPFYSNDKQQLERKRHIGNLIL
jgi:RAP1 GTPase activating protein 1